MATLSGAGVGEAVDPSFISQVQGWDTAKLQRYAKGGLSDQQTAYVQRQLALRSAGVQETASQKEIIAAYAEQRTAISQPKPQIRIGTSPERQAEIEQQKQYQYSQPIGPVKPKSSAQIIKEDFARKAALKAEQKQSLRPVEAARVRAENKPQSYATPALPRTPTQRFVGETTGKVKKFAAQPSATASLGTDIIEYTSDKGKFIQGTGGFVSGLVPTTKGQALITGASFVGGAAIGAGVKAGGIAASRIGTGAKTVYSLSTTAAGTTLTGLYARQKVTEFKMESTPFGKGEVIGGTAREFAAIGGGFAVGGKGALKGYDVWRTRGRKEIDIERLVPEKVLSGKESFPTAPSGKHLQLFQQTKYKFPEFSDKAGGFHVTPESFWKGGTIKAQTGTSELAGLYVSSYSSVHFAKVGGSGSSLKGAFKFPSLKDLSGSENPAIAYLVPRGFREVGFKQVKPFKIGEQTFKYKFKKPAKEGVLDIPKMKTEIEAISRTDGGGEFKFVKGKYYTTYKGRRLPLDVFESVKTGEVKSVKLPSQTKGKQFKASSYQPPSSKVSYGRGLSSLSIPKSSYKPSSFTSSRVSSKVSPSSYSKISSKVSPSSYSKISSSYSPSYLKSSGRSSKTSSRVSGVSSGYSPSSYSYSGSSTGGKKITTPSFLRQKGRTPTKKRGGYGVQVRRFGTFRTIGTGLTQQQAFKLGKQRVATGLGATFKITGGKITGSGTPTGFYRKKGGLFIEKRKYRLSTGSEKKEIQAFNRATKLKGGVF